MLIRTAYFVGLLLISSVSFAVGVAESQPDNEICVPEGKVLLPHNGQWINNVALTKSLSNKEVVLLGEHHDNIEHHRWQLQMISGLHTLKPNMVLGFEMFPRKMQPVLDKWVTGDLTEKDFLKEVEWSEYWSFDAELYLPMFHFARMNRIPMVALNVERALIREVGKNGWDGVAEELREGVGKAEPASQGYRELLASVFMQHDADHESKTIDPEALAKVLENPGFNRFVESQQVWDRAMAEAIVNGAKQHDNAFVVGVMGSGHMMYHYGVPEQLSALDMANSAVIIPWDPEFECDYIKEDFATAVVGLKAIRHSDDESKNKPRLGIYLENSANGVLITKLVKNSVAEKSGLNKDDIIVEAAGKAVSEVGQVIDIVKGMQFGTWLPIKIIRKNESMEIIAKFPVSSN